MAQWEKRRPFIAVKSIYIYEMLERKMTFQPGSAKTKIWNLRSLSSALC